MLSSSPLDDKWALGKEQSWGRHCSSPALETQDINTAPATALSSGGQKTCRFCVSNNGN